MNVIRTMGLLVLLALGPATPGLAHPLAPALLEFRDAGDGQVEMLWRSSRFRAAGRAPQPLLPAGCEAQGAPQVQDEPTARSERRTLHCSSVLRGQWLRVEGLEGSGINVIARVLQADGGTLQALLSERSPAWQVPPVEAPPPVFSGYLLLGVEHLWGGFDHLCFVIGLVLLLRRLRPLLIGITAFTLGHSLTLGLAVLGFVRIDPALTEFAIAASIVLLALELLRAPERGPGPVARWPALLPAAFGLLHGLGFAGALGAIGLPQGEIPLALFAFNLGIELGQLSLVAALLVAAALVRRRVAEGLHPRWPVLPAYLIGTLAAAWCLERVGALWS